MPFGVLTRMGHRNHELDGGRDPWRKETSFGGCLSHWKALWVTTELYAAKQIDNGVTAPLLQLTAMLPASRCYITLSPGKIFPCDEAFCQNSLTTCHYCCHQHCRHRRHHYSITVCLTVQAVAGLEGGGSCSQAHDARGAKNKHNKTISWLTTTKVRSWIKFAKWANSSLSQHCYYGCHVERVGLLASDEFRGGGALRCFCPWASKTLVTRCCSSEWVSLLWCRRIGDETLQSDEADAEDGNNNDRDVFDCTNMFHWCPAPSFHDVVLVPLSSLLLNFQDQFALRVMKNMMFSFRVLGRGYTMCPNWSKAKILTSSSWSF